MTRETFLPFSKPSISDADIQAVVEVLRSGWITTGPNANAFEKEFAEYTHARQAIALSSATGGMHLALKTLCIGPGDEVITPAMTWVSTVNMITLAGAKPVFVDIDRDTMMVNVEKIREKLTERTKLVIPVHFAGAAADVDPIRKLTSEYNIAMIEDAAHAVGTEYNGNMIGSRGTSIFSFHPIKNMTTCEGGMLCSDDETFSERVRRIKFHGLGVDAYDRKMQGRSPQAEVVEPGYKYNLPDILAALGRSQLARVNELNRQRAELAGYYKQRLAEIPEIIPLAEPEYSFKHAWHLFVVRLDIDKAGLTRDEFMEALKQRNIGTGLHFRAVHLQKFYRENMDIRPGMLPNTEWNSNRITSLPLFPGMTTRDIDDVTQAIKDVLAGKKS